MLSPEENSDGVFSPFSDVRENVRRFNEDEAVWRCFARKRAWRDDSAGLSLRLIHRSPKSSSMISTGSPQSAKPDRSGRSGRGSRREIQSAPDSSRATDLSYPRGQKVMLDAEFTEASRTPLSPIRLHRAGRCHALECAAQFASRASKHCYHARFRSAARDADVKRGSCSETARS